MMKSVFTPVLLLMFLGNTLPMSCLTMEVQALFSSMKEDHSCCENQSTQGSTSKTESKDQNAADFETCDCSDLIYSHADQSVDSPIVLAQSHFEKDYYLLQLQKYSLVKPYEDPPILSRDFQQIENKQSFII